MTVINIPSLFQYIYQLFFYYLDKLTIFFWWYWHFSSWVLMFSFSWRRCNWASLNCSVRLWISLSLEQRSLIRHCSTSLSLLNLLWSNLFWSKTIHYSINRWIIYIQSNTILLTLELHTYIQLLISRNDKIVRINNKCHENQV